VLTGAHHGDNDQITTLAKALHFDYRIDADDQSIVSILTDRIARARLTYRRRGTGAIKGPPWPDLILIAGGRRVGDALRIKRANGGRTRIVCIGRPWFNLKDFDLVVTTAQYCLPQHQNVLRNTLTLNQADKGELVEAGQRWAERLAHLPKPWIAVVVGGNSGSYSFEPEMVRRLIEEAHAYRSLHGGSLLVTTSPRTPTDAISVLRDSLQEPHVFYPWARDNTRNPYLGYLALADRFIVTCDSASIISQVCSTGRPVKLFSFRPRLRSRISVAIQRPFLEYIERLIIAGYWTPPRDMSQFHAALQKAGLIEDPSGELYEITTDRSLDLERAVQSILNLFTDWELAGATEIEDSSINFASKEAIAR
jgi:mitochondrial fission protein ELM1